MKGPRGDALQSLFQTSCSTHSGNCSHPGFLSHPFDHSRRNTRGNLEWHGEGGACMTSFSAPLRQQTGAARLRLKLLAASRDSALLPAWAETVDTEKRNRPVARRTRRRNPKGV